MQCYQHNFPGFQTAGGHPPTRSVSTSPPIDGIVTHAGERATAWRTFVIDRQTVTVDGDNAKWEIVPDGKNLKVIPPQLSKSWRPSITSEKVKLWKFESAEAFQGRQIFCCCGDGDITKIALLPLALPSIPRIKMSLWRGFFHEHGTALAPEGPFGKCFLKIGIYCVPFIYDLYYMLCFIKYAQI